MQVEFVSHASVKIQALTRTIVTDPWFGGKVFNDAWALVTPPVDRGLLRGADYIWISHEHPDHFHLPTLKSIPDHDKRRMTVLYQRHASRRILDALARLGFTNIKELPIYQWHALEPGIDVFCGSSGTMDSFLAVKGEGQCVLDVNDCVFNVDQLKYLKKLVGNIDLLLTQFSFANWVGNDRDDLDGAASKITQLKNQIEVLEPVFTVPFASFSYFCNQENSRMNAWANTPDRIAALGLRDVHFMYPGDIWCLGHATPDSLGAVERYMRDYATRRVVDPSPPSVDISEISRAIEQCLSRTESSSAGVLLRLCQPFDIHIKDLDKLVFVDPPRRRHRVVLATPELARRARYVMCSQVAWYTFAFPWGPATTQVGGMFLDRGFAKQGANRFFRLQNAVATEVLRLDGWGQALRTGEFWWRKKGELLYRMTGALRGQGAGD